MSVDNAHPSQLRLDEYVAGELGAGQAEVAAHVAACATCAARLAATEQAQASFRTTAPALELRRRATPPRWSWRPMLGGAALALGALALFVVSRGERTGTRTKGAPVFQAYVKNAWGVRAVANGDLVRAGDAIQFEFPAPGDAFVAVLGRDGTGRAAVLFPSGERAGRPDGAARFSNVLDDAPGPETFRVFFCAEPVALEPLRGAFERDAAAPAPSGCAAESLTLKKAGP